MVATGVHSEEPIQEQVVQRQATATYSRRITRSTRAADASEAEAAETNKDDAAGKNEGKRRANCKAVVVRKKLEVANKDDGTKKDAAGKNKRLKLDLVKEQQAWRDEHEKRLEQLRNDANEEIAKLNSSVLGANGSSAAACDANFPEDPIDDINFLTLPVRLSQEEREQGSQDFNRFQ